jgi:uncharacterized NAD(P)/FAD-binding protein YdhS
LIDNVAIVGGGFSGTLLAVNLLRHDGPRATLIERSSAVGKGLAYGAAHPSHVLNVRAANMSAFPDDPGHFVRWLAARGTADAGGAFVSRSTYGEYLQELLAASLRTANGRLSLVTGDVTDLVDHKDGTVRLRLDGGDILTSDAAVLAVGNLPPHAPPGLDPDRLSPRRYKGDPWASGVCDDLTDSDTVLVIGTGLTMVDAVLMLEARGFGGTIVALSRRGLVPHRHAPAHPPERPRDTRPATVASALVQGVRKRAGEIGWRQAVDELRPFTQGMWANASVEERRRFVRHLRPWWDVHRHRLAPVVADRLAALQASGRLRVRAGKTIAFQEGEAGISVEWRPRGQEQAERLLVQRIINCTGPQGDLARTDEPILANLLARGSIRADEARLGLAVDAGTAVIDAGGHASTRLFALGPMTRGAFWEIVAVPDIRRQAWDLARRLSNAHWVGGEGL